MVKLEIGGVSVLLEQVDDPFLLFGREQLLAVMVAIIGAVAAKVVLEGVAQGRGVFLLHLVEERVEAPCRVNLPCWLEVGTVVAACRGGVDGDARRDATRDDA